MLITKDLKFTYPKGRDFHFPDLNCSAGENLVIMGMSGSGKTTLMHLLAGILTPSAGQVIFNGKNISGYSPSEMDAFRGKNIGMIFQKHFFIHGLSVFENLVAAQKLSGSPTDKSYLNGLLEKLHITDLAGKKADALSQGEQQRFSIARALANKPSWVLADEPTSSLDDENCDKFRELMNISPGENTLGWIIATHDNRLKSHFTNVYQL